MVRGQLRVDLQADRNTAVFLAPPELACYNTATSPSGVIAPPMNHVIVILCALAVPPTGRPAPASIGTVFRGGTIAFTTASASDHDRLLTQQRGRHVLIRLTRRLTAAQRRTLADNGLELQTYLGERTWFAKVRHDIAIEQTTPLVEATGPISTAWKLHPLLAGQHLPHWTVLEGSTAAPTRVVLNVLVHDDVSDDAATAAVVSQGGAVVARLMSLKGMVVTLDPENITTLADEDVISWIEPPLPPLGETNDGGRLLSGAQALRTTAPHLRGAGVSAMIYDVGVIDLAHPDFTGRVTIGPADTNFISIHSTHVAGTAGGDGRAFCGLFSGMAPEVDLLSYGFRSDGADVPLYTNIGDVEEDYAEAQSLGAAVSNNSIGTNICQNGINDPELWDCTYTGDYGLMSATIDAIATGSIGHRMPIVWAAGNERLCDRCTDAGGADAQGYHSTAPPSCAKNPIVVGAVNSDDAWVAPFSSWGPCDDGRLRPDVVAPGCESSGDFGITSTSLEGGYITACGTSMAAPVVTGLGAIVIEEHRRLFPEAPDPDGATFKALAIHNATDLGVDGPDFQYGYGLIDFEKTIEFLSTGHFTTAAVAQNDTIGFGVEVGPDDTTLKITIVWDDAPGAPHVTTALVNDLDLVARAPDGSEHQPWTLDPAQPAKPATRTAADHRNNVEQIVIDEPQIGAWQIEVRGHAVPQGPQPFALCASPTLLTCDSAATLRLDSTRYGCEGVAVIEVVDCDLNLDDDASDTTTVRVTSNTEPAGIEVELTEVDNTSATFRGLVTFDLGGTGGTDFIVVSPNDTLNTTYLDADDGHGGQDVVVSDSALIDCLSPVITRSDVTATAFPQATVEVDVTEPAVVTVLYGPGCKELIHSTSSTAAATHHVLQLAGVDPRFSFVTVARDLAGNTSDTACRLLAEPDCNNNGQGDFSEVATGAVPDCNDNRIPDSCDVADGAPDCQRDGIPDTCQLDCNANGIPDVCDLTSGGSADCNANDIPDECDVLFTGPQRTIDFDPPAMIEPGGAVFDTIEIDHFGIIETLVVGVDITHSNTPSLRLRLSNGTDVVTLFDACVAPGQDLRNTVFRDDAAQHICSATPPYTGSFRPVQPLSTFSGTLAHGDWSLVISAIDEVGCGSLERWSLTMPMAAPDCNLNGIPDSCDITSGTSSDDDANGVPDDCEDGCPRIAGSTPVSGAIDARQPHALDDAAVRQGWTGLTLDLINVFGEISADDFALTETGGDGRPPTISDITTTPNGLFIEWDVALEPGTWTTLTHTCNEVTIRLGYLPGDVNGDAVSNSLDILDLIDVLNGITTLPDHATDIDRSMATEPLDILRLIDLLNGAGAFDVWNGRTLP